MRNHILILVLFLMAGTGCESTKSLSTGSDCPSSKIEESDQCLIGKSLGQAMEVLKLERSRVSLQPKDANLECFRYQWADRVIEFYCTVDKTQKLPSGAGSLEDLEGDTENSRALLIKPIVAIRWSLDGGANMHYAGSWSERRQKRL